MLITLFFPKFLVIHIIRPFSGAYVTARGSLLKTDSMHHSRNHYWDGQSCLGCRQAAFPGVKANLVSKLCRLLAKRIRFLLPPDNSTSLPQVHPAYSWSGPERLARAPCCPAPRVPAALLPCKWSRLPRLGCFWMPAQLPDRVTAVASHLEWGLMWDMQKIIIKARPTAQLAQPHHATREQIFLSLTPGAFVGLSKGLGNMPAFPGTSTL